MGNGVSGDQGNLPAYGKRDVGVTFDRKQHDWSEQARAQEVNSLVSNVNPYNGAQLRDSKPEDNSHVGGATSYSDAFNTGPSPSVEDNVCDAYIDAASVKPIPSTEEDDTLHAAYVAYNSAQNRKSSVMKDDACSDVPNRNQKSSVMEDDTQSVMNGNTGLRNRKKKEDRGLKTEESKTKGNMQVETDTGQTVYTQVEPETGQTAYIQVEPDTGQTAYTSPSMTVPLPEEDRRVALLSVDHAVARQTEEEPPVFNDRLVLSPIETSVSMLQLEDTVDKLLPKPQVYNFRSKPETEIESSERTDPAQLCCSSCKEEPLAKPDIEIQGETRLLNEENLVHNDTRDNDVPTRQDCKGKAEVDAKVGATRHLPSRSS